MGGAMTLHDGNSTVPATAGDALAERFRPRIGIEDLRALSGRLQAKIQRLSPNNSQAPYFEAVDTRIQLWIGQLERRGGREVRPRMTDVDIACLLRCDLPPLMRAKIEGIRDGHRVTA